MSVTFILIPGLGDQRPVFGWFYKQVQKRWQRFSMCTRVLWPKWVSKEPYERKYQRLRALIIEERQQGREVVLVGISAGAALGLLAFAEGGGDITAFVSVCGFTQLKPTDVTNKDLMKLSWFQATNRAELAARALTAAERKRILSFIPRSDNVIAPRQEYIGGAKNLRMHTHGHMVSLVVVLLWRRRMIADFVTSRD